MSNYLEVPDNQENRTFENLFIEATNELKELNLPNQNAPDEICKSIKPTPGFCIKTRDENGKKVFVNICHSPELPKPPEISESMLHSILDSDDPTTYRIPMSLGEGREESDKSGQICTVYDIIINSEYYAEVIKSEFLKTFLITVSLEGIDDKYQAPLDKNTYIILKNKKYHGTMPGHNIKFRPKPLVTEIGGSNIQSKENAAGSSSSIKKSESLPSPNVPSFKIRKEPSSIKKSESLPSPNVPSFKIRKEPKDKQPEYLIAEINLSGVKSVEELLLDVGEDRIILNSKSNKYNLDIFLPYFIEQDNCQAQFNRIKQTLKIRMPVVLEETKR